MVSRPEDVRRFREVLPQRHGYTALKDVVTKERRDAMESFVFAETFKYYYLIFAPPATLDFDQVVFNTEAHPLQRMPTRP